MDDRQEALIRLRALALAVLLTGVAAFAAEPLESLVP